MGKLNPALKERVIKRIKDGYYKHTKGAFKNNDGFCIVGAIVDCYNPEIWGNPLFWRKDNHIALPESMLSQIGLDQQDINVLSGLNDLSDSYELALEYLEICL